MLLMNGMTNQIHVMGSLGTNITSLAGKRLLLSNDGDAKKRSINRPVSITATVDCIRHYFRRLALDDHGSPKAGQGMVLLCEILHTLRLEWHTASILFSLRPQ